MYGFLFFVLILTGCSASGPKFTEFAAMIPVLETQKSQVFLIRPSLFVRSVASPDIKLNNHNQNLGREIGELPNGSFIYFDVDPGSLTLRTIRQGSLGQSDKIYNLTHQFEEGKEYYFEITLQNADRVIKMLWGLASGHLELSPCHHLVSS